MSFIIVSLTYQLPFSQFLLLEIQRVSFYFLFYLYTYTDIYDIYDKCVVGKMLEKS